MGRRPYLRPVDILVSLAEVVGKSMLARGNDQAFYFRSVAVTKRVISHLKRFMLPGVPVGVVPLLMARVLHSGWSAESLQLSPTTSSLATPLYCPVPIGTWYSVNRLSPAGCLAC